MKHLIRELLAEAAKIGETDHENLQLYQADSRVVTHGNYLLLYRMGRAGKPILYCDHGRLGRGVATFATFADLLRHRRRAADLAEFDQHMSATWVELAEIVEGSGTGNSFHYARGGMVVMHWQQLRPTG